MSKLSAGILVALITCSAFVITPFGGRANAATFYPSAGSHDAFDREDESFWQLSLNYLIARSNPAVGSRYGAGVLFDNVTVPQGATITQAYLEVYCYDTNRRPESYHLWQRR